MKLFEKHHANFTGSFMKGAEHMKKYFVLCARKGYVFRLHTNSLVLANYLLRLKLWTYAKIHDNQTRLCIAINDRRG